MTPTRWILVKNEEWAERNKSKDYDHILQTDRSREFSMEYIYESLRRDKIINAIEQHGGKKILDVGCGPNPIFKYIPDVNFYIGVEPSKLFYDNAMKLATSVSNGRIKILLGKIEAAVSSIPDEEYDFIILSSLLHEVEDPGKVLKLIQPFCNSKTLILAVVPNTRSIHRLLAYKSGLIASIYEDSDKDKLFGRKTHFDINKFQELFRKNGFCVIKTETFFMKFLSDSQLEAMLESGIISKKTLTALEKMSEYIPDFGAEIYLEAKKPENTED